MGEHYGDLSGGSDEPLIWNWSFKGNFTELEIPLYIRIVSTAFCCAVFLVGVIGNLMVPMIIVMNKDMQNSTHLFLLNLSLADLLVLLVCLPTAFVELHSPPDVWFLGNSMCECQTFLLASLIFLIRIFFVN